MPKRHVWIAILCLLPTLASADYCPDFDCDGVVSGADWLVFKAAFHSSVGDANYVADVDANKDGKIGGSDFLAFKKAWMEGQVCDYARILFCSSSSEYESYYGGTVWLDGKAEDGSLFVIESWEENECVRIPKLTDIRVRYRGVSEPVSASSGTGAVCPDTTGPSL